MSLNARTFQVSGVEVKTYFIWRGSIIGQYLRLIIAQFGSESRPFYHRALRVPFFLALPSRNLPTWSDVYDCSTEIQKRGYSSRLAGVSFRVSPKTKTGSFLSAPVAQLVEHRPFKAGVLGSSPSRRTIGANSNYYFQNSLDGLNTFLPREQSPVRVRLLDTSICAQLYMAPQYNWQYNRL